MIDDPHDVPGKTPEDVAQDATGNVPPDACSDLQAAVVGLAGQVEALLPQARQTLGEQRFAELAGRTGQIRQEALRGINEKTLLEDRVWLDQSLAELLGVVQRP